MNKAQRIVIAFGLGAIVLLGLFPPWTMVRSLDGRPTRLMSGHRSIFSIPAPTGNPDDGTYYEIDYSRLLRLAGISAVAFGGGFALLKK